MKYNVIFYKDAKHVHSVIDTNLSSAVFINIGVSYGGRAPKFGCFTDFSQESGDDRIWRPADTAFSTMISPWKAHGEKNLK